MSYQHYQQQAQQSPAVAPAMEWNGSAWVPVAAAPSYSQHSQYSSQFQHQTPSAPAAQNKPLKSPVELYTEYYHGWQAAEKEYERTVAPGAERKRQVQWAQYYADLSSRAAHHYYQTPSQPVPFDLPPAPPKLTTTTTPEIATVAVNRKDDKPTTSLTSYVQRCLAQCTTPAQRKAVQAQVEQVIAKAIQANNLATKDWSLEPLIPVLTGAPAASIATAHQPPSNLYYGSSSTSGAGGGIYGPASSVPGPYGPASSSIPSVSSRYSQKKSKTATSPYVPTSTNLSSSPTSYYGPASTTSLLSHSDSSQSPISNKSNSNKWSKKRKNNLHGDDNGMDRSSHALSKRQARFSNTSGQATPSTNPEEDYSKYMGLSTIGGGLKSKTLTEQDYENMTVKGTCQVLEKEYLRLTAPPKPELVRPPSILQQHFENLTGGIKYKSKDYLWMCSQYKALRQDLTIQRIRNTLTVKVYEAHARLALQHGDWNEFNQCQTQLPELYATSSSTSNGDIATSVDEFQAYRLLYHVYLTLMTSSDHAAAALEILKSLSIQNPGPALQHACKIRTAVVQNDFVTFFRLHSQAPHLGQCLTDRMIPTMRFRALKRLVKAYRPSVEFDYCQVILGMADAANECKDYIESCGGQISSSTEDPAVIKLLCKESDGQLHEPETDAPNSLLK